MGFLEAKEETIDEHWIFDKMKLLGNARASATVKTFDCCYFFGQIVQLFPKNPEPS